MTPISLIFFAGVVRDSPKLSFDFVHIHTVSLGCEYTVSQLPVLSPCVLGGFVVVTMRDEHLTTVDEYRNNMRPTIQKLVSEGRWEVIKDETFPDWCFSKDGKGIDGRLFVFKKL